MTSLTLPARVLRVTCAIAVFWPFLDRNAQVARERSCALDTLCLLSDRVSSALSRFAKSFGNRFRSALARFGRKFLSNVGTRPDACDTGGHDRSSWPGVPERFEGSCSSCSTAHPGGDRRPEEPGPLGRRERAAAPRSRAGLASTRASRVRAVLASRGSAAGPCSVGLPALWLDPPGVRLGNVPAVRGLAVLFEGGAL